MKKTVKFLKTLVGIVFFALIGFLSAYYSIRFLEDGNSPFVLWLYGASIILSLIFAVFVHEMGHLVFGRLTGFKFSSFRVLNLLIIKASSRLKIIVSPSPLGQIMGQCLLYNDKHYALSKKPYFWYNAGGILFNLFFACLCVPLIMFGTGLVAFLGWMSLIVNLLFAVTNGIPTSNERTLNNDGNTIKLCKLYPVELDGLYATLNINRKLMLGEELRNLELNHSTPLENAKILSLYTYLLTFDQLIARLEYEDARILGEELLKTPHIKSFYRDLVLVEMLFIELMTKRNPVVIRQYDTKKLFRYQMSNVTRVHYAYGKYSGYDEKKLIKLKKQFHKQLYCTPEKGTIPSAIVLFEQAEGVEVSHVL